MTFRSFKVIYLCLPMNLLSLCNELFWIFRSDTQLDNDFWEELLNLCSVHLIGHVFNSATGIGSRERGSWGIISGNRTTTGLCKVECGRHLVVTTPVSCHQQTCEILGLARYSGALHLMGRHFQLFK